jgi:MAF protein
MRGVENRVEAVVPGALEGPAKPGETAAQYVARLASEKAASARSHASSGVLLTADTVVVLGERLLGKPRTDGEARLMLNALRGRTHHVLTGVSVLDLHTGKRAAHVKESAVKMRRYASREVDRYLSTGTHLDRAGAYGVQDRSFSPVTSVEGCYLNAVGLPLCTVVKLIRDVGAHVALREPDRVPYLRSCVRCELDCRREA